MLQGCFIPDVLINPYMLLGARAATGNPSGFGRVGTVGHRAGWSVGLLVLVKRRIFTYFSGLQVLISHLL